MSSLFWIAFIIASPFVLNRLTFVPAIIQDSRVVGWGHMFAASGSPLDWFPILASPHAAGVMPVALAGVGLVWFFRRLVREGVRALASAEGVLWTWTLVVLVLLLTRVNLREDRYLLPIIPPIIILGGVSFARLLRAAHLARPRLVGAAAVLLAAGWVAWELAGGVERQRALVQERQAREESSESVAVGRWLQDHIGADARVLYDWYSYVPPTFSTVSASWGMHEAEVARFNPDVIVVNDRIRNRFAAVEDAARFYDGPASFMSRFNYYRALEEGLLNFDRVATTDSIRIYRRRPQPTP